MGGELLLLSLGTIMLISPILPLFDQREPIGVLQRRANSSNVVMSRHFDNGRSGRKSSLQISLQRCPL
jgi:hypothetical protein